ncbi:MAG TPA: gluconokinase [Candidatus Limnocylindria bacterium]|nr:gluconokinase [Candidatus Limnocylindria bacterium]
MSPRRQRLTTLVVMGVAGSGKTTVMAALADRLGWPTLEGDSLHPPKNVAKMAAGIPLDDADRAPWLAEIARWIGDREAARASSLVTCSALRRPYRDLIRAGHPSAWFVHLVAPVEVLASRMAEREGHFMPASLLASQLAALEPLEREEPGSSVNAVEDPAAIADQIITELRLTA